MKEFFNRYVKICPKTGKFRGFRSVKGFSRFILPLIGLLAFLWIIFRVISKPSRINYPCVKAAMPFAAGFILNIIIFITSAYAFARIKNPAFKTQFVLAALLVTFTIGSNFSDNNSELNNPTIYLDPNEPMGEAKGIFPGRVVWVHNPDATNENCDPMEEGNSYFEPKNSNQDVIDQMLSQAIQSLTGKTSDSEAWDAIFKFHNKGEVGYQAGEKVFIKMNATSAWSGNYNNNDLSKVYQSQWGGVNRYYGLSETSPAFILSVLRQLVNNANVAQEDIYIGDPMKFIYKHIYEYLHAEFPNVHYLDHTGHTNLGRELAIKGTTPLVKYSDRGTVLVDGGAGNDPVYEDKLYKIYEDMKYMLNLPQMKGHVRAGVTMFAKNHFGSHTRDGANHLHNGLMLPGETGLVARPGYGRYRTQVDLMGHEILGKKNLVYLMDALWGTDHELNPPTKWQSAPFNNDWTSSVFASLDPVAIESVGYDFVRTEFTKERYPSSEGDVVDVIQMEGVCDYLEQAADSANWPEGIQYDPENDGTILTSLGVHEHWNNPIDKEYSGNIEPGSGIELVKISNAVTSVAAPSTLTASVVNNSDVELSWLDNSDNEEGFIIERKENLENKDFLILDTTAANQTTYIDTSEKFVESYYYRIKAYHSSVNSDYTEPVMVEGLIVVGVEEEFIANDFHLNQNYPNPFNPATTISFSLNKNAQVKLSIYDALGRLVKVLLDDRLSEGHHDIKWNSTNYSGASVGSGVYIYKIIVKAENELFSQSRKMLLVK